MKSAIKIAMAATAAVCCFQTAAHAQAATANIPLQATVAAFCRIGGGAVFNNPTVTIPVSAVGIVDTTVIPVTVGSVTCNRAADIAMTTTAGGVTNVAAAPGGFTNVIEYSATAQLNGAGGTATIDTSALGAGGAGTGATSAGAVGNQNLVVNITPIAPALGLIQGTYNDTLVVTLTPTP